MNRALILHIGHHRTGTTTLQTAVFPQLTGVTYFCYRDAASGLTEFIGAFNWSPAIWRSRGDDIFARLCAEMRARGRPASALISAEEISGYSIFAARDRLAPNRRRDPFLLAAHLRECWAAAERAGFDRVKVIVGIRRQDQYLGSRYAENGWKAESPSQGDFESQTLEIIDPDKRYFVDGIWLDYNATRDVIMDVVGEDNLLMLPLEQLGSEPSVYFSRLSQFLGESLSEGETLAHEKSRGIALDVWRLKDKETNRAARERGFGTVRSLLARPIEIRLTPDLKERILERYRDSNRSLASSLKLDLARYGYCPERSA
jgi:hypothetical protein